MVAVNKVQQARLPQRATAVADLCGSRTAIQLADAGIETLHHLKATSEQDLAKLPRLDGGQRKKAIAAKRLLKVGGRTLWDAVRIREWIRDGCPNCSK